MAYEIDEIKKVGLGLIGFGILFSLLGVILFFDRGLLALGNIFWLTGVALLLGWRSTWRLFTNQANYKGSASFILGLFFLFVRWPVVGIILEIYGCIVLFGGFWPSVKVFLYEIPVVGWIIRFLFWNDFDAMINNFLYPVWYCGKHFMAKDVQDESDIGTKEYSEFSSPLQGAQADRLFFFRYSQNCRQLSTAQQN